MTALQTQSDFEQVKNLMQTGISRGQACATLGLRQSNFTAKLTFDQNEDLKQVTRALRHKSNLLKFEKAKELIIEGAPHWKALALASLSPSKMSSEQSKILKALAKPLSERQVEQTNETFAKIVQLMETEGYGFTKCGKILGINTTFFLLKLKEDQRVKIDSLRENYKEMLKKKDPFVLKKDVEYEPQMVKIQYLSDTDKVNLQEGKIQIRVTKRTENYVKELIDELFTDPCTSLEPPCYLTALKHGTHKGMWKISETELEEPKLIEI